MEAGDASVKAGEVVVVIGGWPGSMISALRCRDAQGLAYLVRLNKVGFPFRLILVLGFKGLALHDRRGGETTLLDLCVCLLDELLLGVHWAHVHHEDVAVLEAVYRGFNGIN